MDWMAWTGPTAFFFSCIFFMLVGMAMAEMRWPSIERKGLLPLATTRGDRLFIGLLSIAFLNLAAVVLFDSIFTLFILSILIFVLIFLKG